MGIPNFSQRGPQVLTLFGKQVFGDPSRQTPSHGQAEVQQNSLWVIMHPEVLSRLLHGEICPLCRGWLWLRFLPQLCGCMWLPTRSH